MDTADIAFSRVVAVVPSLNPDEKLYKVVWGLHREGFCRIVVINDGSAEAHLEPFEQCKQVPGTVVLTHPQNRGKGAAMKTAFGYIMNELPDSAGAVTVDGDAQHRPEDCRKCVEKMLAEDKVVLGVRDFSGKDVPKRSSMGNNITKAAFRIFCGMKISDTQTGLRAFPMDVLPLVSKTKGDRYEYETEMLLDFKKYRIPYTEQVIQTVYIEENQTSHFRVFRDSARIYKRILGHFFKYSVASVVSSLLEWGIVSLTVYLLINNTDYTMRQRTAIAFIIGRIISSAVNFVVNRIVVFDSKTTLGKSLLKYYTLCIPLAVVGLLIELFGVSLLARWTGSDGVHVNMIVHPIVTVILFAGTYLLQREWVFRTDKKFVFRKGAATKKDGSKSKDKSKNGMKKKEKDQ